MFVLFSLPGLALASWVTRTPDVRDVLHASTGLMGLVLFGLSAGSMVGILTSGAMVRRLGTRTVIAGGALCVTASMVVVGVGSAIASPLLVGIGLAVFGLGMGGGEVALNVEGAEIERLLEAPTLTAMHGFFSIGTVVGATCGLLATALSVPVLWHLLPVAGVVAAAALWGMTGVPRGRSRPHAPTPTLSSGDGGVTDRRRALRRDRRLAVIGIIVLALALAEGAANDWLPLLMVDGHDFPITMGSLIFVAFSASMAAGRFVGNSVLRRFSHATVLAASSALGAVGLAVVIFAEDPVWAGAAVVLWGLGASLGFPVALSAASASGDDPDSRVAFVAVIGYVAFLVGPPALGILGEQYGLRGTMVLVLALVLLAAGASVALRRDPAQRAEHETAN